MKVVVAGGFGWLGSALCRSLSADGHDVVALSRSPGSKSGPNGVRGVAWDGESVGPWASELDGADAVVNFSGESIANGRWTSERKRRIWASRTAPTAALVSAIEQATRRPPILVNASAVGYYGDRGDQVVTEAEPPGTDFLACLVDEWERTALSAADLGVRVCVMRQGIVFGPHGGALPPLALPFRFFLGGRIGSGRQWVSWVHIDDVVGLFRFAIERADAEGPLNVTAPEPVTNRQLADLLGAVLRRPAWMPVPEFALRLALGELGEALLTGQRAVPAAAQRLGYTFHHPTLAPALQVSLGAAA